MQAPTLPRLLRLFGRVGNLTFGGGDPTMMVFYQELVVLRRWLSPETYGLIYGLARVTPGTNLLAFCAGVGWWLERWRGALGTVIAVAAPTGLLVVGVTAAFVSLQGNRLATAAIGGMLAAAIGMMVGGAWQIVQPQWRPGLRWRAFVLPAVAFALSSLAGWSPVPVLVLGAAVGVIWRPKGSS